MKKLINVRQWEQLLQENPELAEDLEIFFRDEEKGVASFIGFYTILKTRLWLMLHGRRAEQANGDARADEEAPPQQSSMKE